MENHDDVPEIPKEKKFETLMSSLKECKEYDLKKSCLEFQYNYGEILEEFFKLWKGNNYKGISWQKWLKENTGVHNRVAKKKSFRKNNW